MAFVGGVSLRRAPRSAQQSERRRMVTAVQAAMKPGGVGKVRSVEDYVRATREQMFSVLMFVSDSCGACEKMEHKLPVFAARYPDKSFYTVEVDKNQTLCKQLGVDELPAFHFYTLRDKNPGTLEMFATSSPGELEGKLEHYAVDKFDVMDYTFEQA